MFKLTTIDGDSVWINPNFIIKIEETVGGTDVYFTSVGGEFNKIVKDSPEEIVKMMRPYLTHIVYLPNENTQEKHSSKFLK